MKRRVFKIIFMVLICGLLVLSISMNIFFYYIDIKPELEIRELQKIESQEVAQLKSIDDFHDKILEKNKEIIISGNRPEAPRLRISFNERKDKVLERNKSKPKPRFYYCEANKLLLSCLEDALLRNDVNLIHTIEVLFDTHIANVEIDHVHQSMCGSVAILLHKYTGDEKYKNYADKMFEWLKSQDTEYGILYVGPDGNINLIDGCGMFVPFLSLYAETYNDKTAEDLAIKQVEMFARYCVDFQTGIPVQMFCVQEPHVKGGDASWGRGTSWYVMGLCSIEDSLLSEYAQLCVRNLDSTLTVLWQRQGKFSQFIMDDSKEDLSATLPIIFYLNCKGCIELTKEDVLLYSKYMHDGLLYNSSASKMGARGYNPLSGPNVLSQAYILSLIDVVK